MANDCWNKVIISGDKKTLQVLETKFSSIGSGNLNYNNYKLMFDSDVSDMDPDDWGPKWYTPYAVLEDDNLVITGDSAWIPPIEFYEILSEEYNVDVELTYEETGMDFAGVTKWEKGNVTFQEEYTSWEYRYINNLDEFYEEAGYSVIYHDSVEEWLNGLNIDKWKIKPEIDVDRLEKIWEEGHED